MKPKQFAVCIEANAKAFGLLGAKATQARLLRLAAVMKRSTADSVESAVRDLNFEVRSTTQEKIKVSCFEPDFTAIAMIASKSSSKSFRDDVNTVSRLVSKYANMGLESFFEKLESRFGTGTPLPTWEPVVAPGQTKVDAYAAALDFAVHDPRQFPQIFEAFKHDPEMNKAAVLEVANRIVFKMPSKTTRDEALARIWKRHVTSETAAMKARATGGKSAA